MKYTKKPVTIEAIQFIGGEHNSRELDAFITCDKSFIGIPAHEIEITTMEGKIIASIGDYVIKGVKGEFYPCKPDIFKLTYSEGFDPSPMEVKDAEAFVKEFCSKMGYDDLTDMLLHRSIKNAKYFIQQMFVDYSVLLSQLQPPVISAEDFLKEKGYKENEEFYILGEKVNIYRLLLKLLADFASRQGKIDYKPLFGHVTGKHGKTIWLCFIKDIQEVNW